MDKGNTELQVQLKESMLNHVSDLIGTVAKDFLKDESIKPEDKLQAMDVLFDTQKFLANYDENVQTLEQARLAKKKINKEL